MIKASSVGIEDPYEAEPILQSALKVALETAPWNTGNTPAASRNDVVEVADKACKDADLRRGSSPRKALNGLLEILANCPWIKGDVQSHARQRLVDAGMNHEAAQDLAEQIATNVVAAARSTNDSILWVAGAKDCPLDDLLGLVFRRALPLVGVSSRARTAAWQLLTSAGMGHLARVKLRDNVFKGGSGQTAIAAVIGTRLATLRDFDALLVTEDLDPMITAFLTNRIPSMRAKTLPGLPEQDRRAIETRFAQIAGQIPALLPIVNQRAGQAAEPKPPRASTTRAATAAEPVVTGSTAGEPAEQMTFPPIFAPLDDELQELFLKGPALAGKANIWKDKVPGLLQEAAVELWEARTVDGRIRQGSWHNALQNQIRANFRVGRSAGQLFDETHIDVNQTPVGSQPDSAGEARPEVVDLFVRLREHYEDLPGSSPAVVLIRVMLADPSVYDDSAAFLDFRKQIGWWVYREVEKRSWVVDRDTLVTQMLASLKASIRALLGPDGLQDLTGETP